MRARYASSAEERAGVEFTPADDTKGPGVRLKHSGRGKEAKRTKRPKKR